jgi:hypothetical protein
LCCAPDRASKLPNNFKYHNNPDLQRVRERWLLTDREVAYFYSKFVALDRNQDGISCFPHSSPQFLLDLLVFPPALVEAEELLCRPFDEDWNTSHSIRFIDTTFRLVAPMASVSGHAVEAKSREKGGDFKFDDIQDAPVVFGYGLLSVPRFPPFSELV